MTVLELVDRERARLRRMHVLVGAALAARRDESVARAWRLRAWRRTLDGAAAVGAILGLVARSRR